MTASMMCGRSAGFKLILWGGALWERGYFVTSNGTGTTNEIILKCMKKHLDHSANDQP
jgi:REP element-mobilizing transposase RayT